MDGFIQNFKKMSKLEKTLLGVTLAGVVLNRMIPNEYPRLEVIPLAVSSIACVGLALKSTYNLFCKPYDSNSDYSPD